MSSDSIDEQEMWFRFLDAQEMGVLLKVKTHPVLDVLLLVSPA